MIKQIGIFLKYYSFFECSLLVLTLGYYQKKSFFLESFKIAYKKIDISNIREATKKKRTANITFVE